MTTSTTYDAIFLSFDTEFTHTVPRLGALMELGAEAVLINTKTMELGDSLGTFSRVFKVDGGRAVTDWVRQNQGPLLSECMLLPQRTHDEHVDDLRAWLSDLSDITGLKEILPAGWVIGCDVAYLLDILGPYYELVSFRTYDLKGILAGYLGKMRVTDNELCRRFKVTPMDESKRHRALDDAKHQTNLFRAVFEAIRESDTPLSQLVDL